MQRTLKSKVLATETPGGAALKSRMEQMRRVPSAVAQRLATATDRPRRPEIPLPTWQQQAANLVKDLTQLGLDVLKGRPIVRPPEERQAALAVCAGCKWWIAQSGRCGKCGCVMAAKVQSLSWTCPLGKWER